MKVIAVFDLELPKEFVAKSPLSSIKIGVLIDQSLSPIPDPLKVIETAWNAVGPSDINNVIAILAEEVKKAYDSVGTLVVMRYYNSILAAALDEVLEDPDVKFEMYKLMGY